MPILFQIITGLGLALLVTIIYFKIEDMVFASRMKNYLELIRPGLDKMIEDRYK